MRKILNALKSVLYGYFKVCGFVVKGFEFIIKKIWQFFTLIAKLIYKYFIRFIIIGFVWFNDKVVLNVGQVLYKFILRPIGVVLIFIHKYPPLKWLKKYIYLPIYKKLLEPIVGIKPNGKRGLSMEQKKALTGYAFISPFIIGLFGLVFYPLGRIIYMSFTKVILVQQDYEFRWLGLQNYHEILRVDIDFVLEAQNFIVRVLLFTPVIITLAVIIAMLLNQSIKGKGFFRMIFFLPIIILNGELLANMSEYGGMDIHLSFFVIDVITTIIPEFAVDLFIELFAIIVEILWYTGVPILIFLAMLQKVDRSLYEAASIDGANGWSRFWKITLPIVSPAITVSIVFIVVFLGNFDGNPINGIISSARSDYGRGEGYASALALIYSFLQIIVITILLLISSRSFRDALFGRNKKKKLISKSQKLKMSKKGA